MNLYIIRCKSHFPGLTSPPRQHCPELLALLAGRKKAGRKRADHTDSRYCHSSHYHCCCDNVADQCADGAAVLRGHHYELRILHGLHGAERSAHDEDARTIIS